MGIRTLLVDKLPRLGDFWRGRYETVRAHTPKHTDHYPFLKFPENWPRWLEQSKLADWIEHYGQVMGLSVMLSTKVTNVVYDPSTRRHKVEIDNAQGKRSLYARQVVLATGLYSDIPIRPSFPGEKTFQGQVYHSSKHKAARLVPDLSQKRVAIIGSGTSAHDIAQDFVNNGAKGVSIVQRGPIFSFAAATIESTMYALWNTPGISTEEADVIGNSIPLPVARTLNLGQSQMMAMQDKDLIEGLEKAGVAIQKPEKVGFGFLDHLFIKTGHFYIDQGASAMIVDGRIKIHRCEEGVKEFVEHGFLLGNGTKVQADLVVLATGFEKNMVSVKQLVGEEAGEQLGPVGDLDKEQERVGVGLDFPHPVLKCLINMLLTSAQWWRPTGLPGFWVTAGSFIWVRQMSLVLALQIAAVEKGLVPGYWDAA
jgi:cation diffusion facilitator CzcD-associated flavoprotein CzcO